MEQHKRQRSIQSNKLSTKRSQTILQAGTVASVKSVETTHLIFSLCGLYDSYVVFQRLSETNTPTGSSGSTWSNTNVHQNVPDNLGGKKCGLQSSVGTTHLISNLCALYASYIVLRRLSEAYTSRKSSASVQSNKIFTKRSHIMLQVGTVASVKSARTTHQISNLCTLYASYIVFQRLSEANTPTG